MSDNTRDWAQEARERWPGCRATYNTDALEVCMGATACIAFRDGAVWRCFGGEALDPIVAIERAIRAEQDCALATLERLRAWGVE